MIAGDVMLVGRPAPSVVAWQNKFEAMLKEGPHSALFGAKKCKINMTTTPAAATVATAAAVVVDEKKQVLVAASLRGFAAAITKMVERKHADFVPIIRKAIDSADAGVAAAAIRAAASADLKDEAKRVRKLLKAKPKDKDTRIPGEVPAACIDYLGRLGIGGDEEAILEDHAIHHLTRRIRVAI